MSEYKSFEELKGRTLTKLESNSQEAVFECADGTRWRLYHGQDCCESVTLDRIEGDPSKLIGHKLTHAVEQPGHAYDPEAHYESVTFSDFTLKDDAGNIVVLHWVGESNGYYSETVEFIQIL